MANRLRDAGKEAFWRDVVRRYEGSGVNVREFCRRERLAESNFYAWRRTIAQRDAGKAGGKRNVATGGKRNGKITSAVRSGKKATAAPRSAVKTAPAFLPVVAGERMRDRADIVLELGGGRRLRLDADTSPRRLAAIVHAIESEADR